MLHLNFLDKLPKGGRSWSNDLTGLGAVGAGTYAMMGGAEGSRTTDHGPNVI